MTFFIQLCNDKNNTYVTYNFLPPVGKYIIQIFYIFLFSLHVVNKRRSSCIRQKFELICFLRQGYLMIDVSTLISLFSKEIKFCIICDDFHEKITLLLLRWLYDQMFIQFKDRSYSFEKNVVNTIIWSLLIIIYI